MGYGMEKNQDKVYRVTWKYQVIHRWIQGFIFCIGQSDH